MKFLSLFFFISQILFSFNLSASNNNSLQTNKNTVNQWNQFVDNIYQLHLKQKDQRQIKTLRRSGSYHKLPDFFQEVKFVDKTSNTLLSKIEWESRQPDKIHSIEVYIHDNENKLIREYSASYLPNFRNAPYQTFINLHHYSRSVHSFRQYDASDNLIYEVCRSLHDNKKLFEHDDYEIPDNFKQGIGKDNIYRQCFQQLPRSAALHLPPH
ncbi:MAG: hypothetical protein OEY11_04220 [Gammaproteobacteria bacterium]|nr:hypothetical protein [Gammaproteobacteria bacterium]